MKIGDSASSFYNVNTDSFNRANTTGSLGNSTRGLPWDNVRQTWEVLSNQAYTSASQNQYALAVGNVGINNINATISIPGSGAGAGIAFWVVDENNWYAAFPYYTQVTGTSCSGTASYCYSNGCTPSGCGGCGVVNASYTTCTNYVTSSSGCAGCNCTTSSGSTCSGSQSCYSAGCTPPGSGCSGITETITPNCNGSVSYCYDSTNTCTPSGCGGCTVYSSINSTCTGPTASCFTTSSSCQPAGTSGCTPSCVGTSYESPTCDFGGQSMSWSAGSCGTQTRTCSFAGQRFTATCNACSANSLVTSYTRSCNQETYSYVRTWSVLVPYTNYTYGQTVTVYQYYCNPPVTATSTLYNFTLIKMVNGSLSTIGTYSCPSAILGLRVQTNNNSITVTGYSDVNLTTQSCQQTYTEASPNRGGKIGLLYGETPAVGSSILDNFGVE